MIGKSPIRATAGRRWASRAGNAIAAAEWNVKKGGAGMRGPERWADVGKERLQVAAEALAKAVDGPEATVYTSDYTFAHEVLKASDAVMFSDASIAEAVWKVGTANDIAPECQEKFITMAHEIVAALKGAGDE